MKTIITGTSRGIGRAAALKFLKEGHEVIGFDIQESSIIDEKYKHIRQSITSKNLPELEGIEILVNNAGVQNSEDDIEVNLKGTINITEKYGIQPNIKAIVMIASASARSGSEFPVYAASKGGVVTYMKNVAQRIAAYKAVCNSISAGGVITELNNHILQSDELWNKVLDETLLHKWSSKEEIADWIYFLAAVNKSMTAQDILIDNGEAAKFNFIW